MDAKILAITALIIGLVIGGAIGYIAKQPQTTQQTGQTPTTPTAKPENYTVKLAYNPQLGLYLTDSKGMTLYFFSKDYDGKSHCYGECATKWPVFYVENIKPSPGLDPNDFGVITRDDGTKQVTYKGWPLYYFFQDQNPGDINGEGKKGVWFVAKPDYTLMIAVNDQLGMYLVDDKGMTLYFFANDQPNNSSCYGMCAENWPVFSPNSLVVPSTLNLTDFTFIQRTDGTTQLAYKGHPLYYWINDQAMGDATGQGVKGVWFVASVSGELPTS